MLRFARPVVAPTRRCISLLPNTALFARFNATMQTATKLRKLMDSNNRHLGFDRATLSQKQIADAAFKQREQSELKDLERAPGVTAEQLAQYREECELKRIRRDFYFQNRAAVVQRAKFKEEKAEVARMAKEIEERYPSNFGIQDVIRLLNAHPENDLAVYDVAAHSTFNDYMVVVTAASVRHMRHMADAFFRIAKTSNMSKTRPNVMSIDGLDSDDWVLVDLGDIMVHFFLKDTRVLHNIEGKWQQARVDPSQFAELRDARVTKCNVVVRVLDNTPWHQEDSDLEEE